MLLKAHVKFFQAAKLGIVAFCPGPANFSSFTVAETTKHNEEMPTTITVLGTFFLAISNQFCRYCFSRIS